MLARFRLVRGSGSAAEEPARETNRGEPDDAPLQQAAAARGWGRGAGRPERRGLGWLLRPRTGAALRRRHPAADVGERLRRADGTLLGVVDLLAIQAEPGGSELHALFAGRGRRGGPVPRAGNRLTA